SLINRTDAVVTAEIRPGTLWVSEDSALQDLMVTRREVIALAPLAKSTVTCRAFCVESTDGAPGEGSSFALARMADAPLVKLAEHVGQHAYPDDLVQQAVWVLSNGHAVSEVAGDDASAALPLRKFVADLAGVQLPWYTTFQDQPVNAGQVYSNAPSRVNGEVDFALNTNALVTIVIRDAAQR